MVQSTPACSSLRACKFGFFDFMSHETRPTGTFCLIEPRNVVLFSGQIREKSRKKLDEMGPNSIKLEISWNVLKRGYFPVPLSNWQSLPLHHFTHSSCYFIASTCAIQKTIFFYKYPYGLPF